MNSETHEGDRLDAIRDRLRYFVTDRDWSQFHDPKNLAMAIASEAGELLAELRWVSNVAADEVVRAAANREQVEREVADIGIALLLFCDRAGIDLLAAISDKITLNERNYPIDKSKGRSERPPTIKKPSSGSSGARGSPT